jgi:Zn-finger nucleic acid-binding protein
MALPPSTCPSCQRTLREVSHHGVSVDVCDCGGIWFDQGEIERWARSAGVARRLQSPRSDVDAGATGVDCMRCAQHGLEWGEHNKVRFARCSQCGGIWLAADAVARLDPARHSAGTEVSIGIGWHVLEGMLWFLSDLA